MRGALVCPTTNYVIDFEAPCAETSLASLWQATFELTCPVCDCQHAITCEVAYKQGVMSEHECPIEGAATLH
ncbi:MAG: hypothetical protein JO000_19150 [Alphaproteobacteria bacterium]|nr:hypothetical protein [Alphaproteobacteria bacterium]